MIETENLGQIFRNTSGRSDGEGRPTSSPRLRKSPKGENGGGGGKKEGEILNLFGLNFDYDSVLVK